MRMAEARRSIFPLLFCPVPTLNVCVCVKGATVFSKRPDVEREREREREREGNGTREK